MSSEKVSLITDASSKDNSFIRSGIQNDPNKNASVGSDADKPPDFTD